MDAESRFNFFQIALLGFFIVVAIVSFSYFAFFQGGGDQRVIADPVVIWGTPLPNTALETLLEELKRENKSYEKITYVEKSPFTIYSDLLEAIAAGNSPDLVVMNASGLLPLKNKIFPIPVETIPVHTFREEFLDGANIFILNDHVYALPLLVDPLVMYWNKALFANAGIAEVPEDWDTFVKMVPRLSKILSGSELTQSAVAFGEYDNVLHAKEIMSALFLQTGAPFVRESEGVFASDMGTQDGSGAPEAALQFYTSFSNPIKTVYSWNKTFDRSREAFAANKVAMYGGMMSEYGTIQNINPNLNFAMALWPQSLNYNKVTYAEVYGIAVLKSSKNIQSAYKVARDLSSSANSARVSALSGLPSAQRSLSSVIDPKDPSALVRSQSAIIARSWLQPGPSTAVDELFSTAITSVVSGTANPTDAVARFEKDLGVLLEQYDEENSS